MTPHTPKKSYIRYDSEDEDMITYDVDEKLMDDHVRVSAADKGYRVYSLDPHSDAVSLYSGYTLGKRRAWYLPDDWHTASLVGLRGGWRHARTKLCTFSYRSNAAVPGNEMSKKSPFAIQKALKGIGGDPKSVRKLRSGDSLIETASAVQSKSFLMAKTFLDSTLTVTPHKSLNSSQGIISEPDLLCASETEILEGLSGQVVTQDIKTTKNISYLKERKLIVPQLSQTYAQVTKPTAISTATQIDPNITKIICPLLQCLSPISVTSSSMPAVSTSSSSTQAHLLPSTSAIIPTIQSEPLLPIPIPTTTTTSPGNNLNTSASSLETEKPVFSQLLINLLHFQLKLNH
ncbi:uncharacterized protein TNCV_1490101 [Trichonephila clavipes]|nr:uncharacterized protein TNCV_1490101 [Trichonephila clavipes]